MKKINILTSILVATALLTACEDDRDSNPTIQEPTTFVLNTPANATYNVYDLNQSKNIELTCTQPGLRLSCRSDLHRASGFNRQMD